MFIYALFSGKLIKDWSFGSLIRCFSDQSTFNQYISRYLKVFLQRHGIRQIEILWLERRTRISMEADLEKVDSLLPQVGSLLHFEVLNLAQLMAYTQEQIWVLLDKKNNSTRRVIFLNPYDHSFNPLSAQTKKKLISEV